MRPASFDASLNWLAAVDHRHLLTRGLRGFEKECLRVGSSGRLSETPHASEWGSALTHPYLTTDYSEALLEFVTPPHERVETAFSLLEELHAFVLRSAGDELLWPASMPCIVDVDESVPIAQYGSSNEGRLRTIYRSGLGFRYGRAMQAIAGIHFNFSLSPDFWLPYHAFLGSKLDVRAFQSERMMGLVRNYRRIGWLVTYLYGASPAFCKSFHPEGHARLESLSSDTWYAPHSTSLRMSDMGYRNSTQARLHISVNSLDEYIRELTMALTTRDPSYEAIGVVVDGKYRQLNANILQLENEYYSSIRPKPASKTPRLVAALRETGIEYVEVRTLDLNPFAPLGVTEDQAKFIEILLIRCLLADGGPVSKPEQDEIDQRELTVAWEGRRPKLSLCQDGRAITLQAWAIEIVDELARLAPLMDDEEGRYVKVVKEAREAVLDSARTMSGQVLEQLRSGTGSFFEWAFEIGHQHKNHFLEHRFLPGRLSSLEALAAESLRDAQALETAADAPFEEFLAAHQAGGPTSGSESSVEICD